MFGKNSGRSPAVFTFVRLQFAESRGSEIIKNEKIIRNEEIPFPELRVVDTDGKLVGTMTKLDAINYARSKGLDLILVAPNAQPPVAKVLDYGKYKYELSKKEQKAKKHQKVIEVKEMKFRPVINEHDYQTKLKHVRRFLEDGNKVKVTVMFRGREMAFLEKGRDILLRIATDVSDLGTIEKEAKVEGRDMIMVLKPKGI